jgi:selenocysteine lyase/cysteine desulfurase
VTHVSGISGVRLPVKEICEEARRRGIYSHVDGAQSWGALHLNLKEMGCDSFAASAHKWPMGPKEAGVLFVRKDHIDSIWPSIVAPGWGARARTEAKGAAKFETLGQRDDACLAGVGAAMDFHALIGPARIERRVLELATVLKQGLSGIPGVRLTTPLAPELSAGFAIVPFAPNIHKRVYEGLYERYGVAVSGGVRICTHIYNTREDVQTAIRGVRELAHG